MTNVWVTEDATRLSMQLSNYVEPVHRQDIHKEALKFGFSPEAPVNFPLAWFSNPYEINLAQQRLTLYPNTVVLKGLNAGIWLNISLLLIGLVFKLKNKFKRSQRGSVDGRKVEKAGHKIKPPSAQELILPVSTSQQVNMFAMFKWRCELPKHVEPQSHFSVTLAKCFNKYRYCSAKYLSSGALAVTLSSLSKDEVEQTVKRLHEVVYQALLAFRGDLSRSAVKCGACFYSEGADQTQVYQIARSSLSVAQNHVWQHIHMLPLNRTLAESLLDAETNVIDDIKAGRFVLFFQPLFDFKTQDVIQSEALLRVRHKTLGLITAGQFIHKIHRSEHLIELDKSIVRQALKVLSKEPKGFTVSVNLHVVNWSNSEFLSWLMAILKESGRAKDVTLELMICDYYQHRSYFEQFFDALSPLGASIVLDHVNGPLDVAPLQKVHNIVGIKLAFELIHDIQSSAKRRAVVKQIVNQAKKLHVPVYAVGVETQDELNCIKRLGVDGAQGYYFSAPLLELENSLN
ncbi:EAL domain-containing protein [Pseudoalteromonas sp. SMS1]|nr:EAL domain-containing protein [Pseudoalteromonas sp. SMS1]